MVTKKLVSGNTNPAHIYGGSGFFTNKEMNFKTTKSNLCPQFGLPVIQMQACPGCCQEFIKEQQHYDLFLSFHRKAIPFLPAGPDHLLHFFQHKLLTSLLQFSMVSEDIIINILVSLSLWWVDPG